MYHILKQKQLHEIPSRCKEIKSGKRLRTAGLLILSARKAPYQLSVHHITTLWSTLSQIRNSWTTCHSHNDAKTATGYSSEVLDNPIIWQP